MNETLTRTDGFLFYDKLELTFSTLWSCYIQIWNLGCIYSKPDIFLTWLVATPTLVLELLIVPLQSPKNPQNKLSLKKNGLVCIYFCGVQHNGDSKICINPSWQNHIDQENFLNFAVVLRIAVAMNKQAAFAGSYNEIPFCLQQFGFGQYGKLSRRQRVVDFHAAHTCCLHVTTMEAVNFQDDILSNPVENSKDYFVLVFDLTSMQDATEKIHYAELVGETVRLEIKLTFPIEHVTEVTVLGECMSPVADDKFGDAEKNIWNAQRCCPANIQLCYCTQVSVPWFVRIKICFNSS